MLSANPYIDLLSSLHWGQLIKFKWYFENKLQVKLYLAPFQQNESVDEHQLIDVQTLFTNYFQEGQQNLQDNQLPFIDIYKKVEDHYFSLRKIIRESNLEFPTIKELRKLKPSPSKELIEV